MILEKDERILKAVKRLNVYIFSREVKRLNEQTETTLGFIFYTADSGQNGRYL